MQQGVAPRSFPSPALASKPDPSQRLDPYYAPEHLQNATSMIARQLNPIRRGVFGFPREARFGRDGVVFAYPAISRLWNHGRTGR